MFSFRIRLFLIAMTLAVGVYHATVGSERGIVFLFAAALLAYGHLRYGTVWIAFVKLQRGREAEAARLLDQVKRPEWLARGQRAYYEQMRGLLALSGGRFAEAIDHLERARSLPLRTEAVRASTELALAQAREGAGADPEAIDEALARAWSLGARPPMRLSIAMMRVSRALASLAEAPGVAVAAVVTREGTLWKRGGVAASLPERLADALAGASLPADAAARLARGETLSVPWPSGRRLRLRLFATKRGFLLSVADDGVGLPEPAEQRVDACVADVEALEPDGDALDEAAIRALLGSAS